MTANRRPGATPAPHAASAGPRSRHNIPTLTERADAPALPAAPATALDQEQLVQAVLDRVARDLTPALDQALAELIAGHMRILEPMLRQEVERVLRSTVTSAVAAERLRRGWN